MRLVLAPLALLALNGCVASALVDIATAPVRVAGKAVDLATTSQSEADERRGRELRQSEERYGKLAREQERERGRCRAGHSNACAKADEIAAEMAELRSEIPAQDD